MTDNKQIFDITGMDCADCARKVSDGVRKLPNVELSEINFATSQLSVTGDVAENVIKARVRELGYEAISFTGEIKPASKSQKSSFIRFLWQRMETRLALVGMILILPGLILGELMGRDWWWVNILSLAAMLAAGWPVARSAFVNLRINQSIDINFLMSIAAIGAVVIGAYVEAGMVIVLFALGEALEGYTAEKARSSIKSLMEVVPPIATRLSTNGSDTKEEEVRVETLQVGDHILVRPGERIPMDGIVLEGQSAVNQASITGESALIDKQVGSEVFASSINGAAALVIEVTHRSEDNTISRVIKMVQEAQNKRAPSQRFIDKFARWYTPIVVVLAALVAVIPPLFYGQPFLNPDDGSLGWLYRGLTLLVISCPCALVISTPVSIISAISNAAGQGVLFKGGLFIEKLSQIKVIAFDKTGTLTEGRPVIVASRSNSHQEFKPVALDCDGCSESIALAHAVERRSQHPLAQAIAQAAKELGVADRYAAASQVTVLPGMGVSGDVGGRLVQIGSHRLIDDGITHSEEDCDQLKKEEENGNTQIHVAVDGDLVGSLLAVDAPRAGSREALTALKALGIKALVMLTGDQPIVAQHIAGQVGVTDFRANLLPEDKVKAVEDLRKEWGEIAMVGDGINDAPALALADVGIAVGGASSSAQAMETADVTLMQPDLRQLPFALRLSRRMMNTIRFNIVFAIGIKAVFMVLAAAGLSTMWMAVVADMGISILVTLNGMRLLKFQ
ncbi:MAG: cation-translocating P-type ATPase [Anaerolineaceae bacterium]|nr:cation-translocating P-type ATPase [Anaerolineaceae bacterium]